MPQYIDGFALPIPRAHLDTYRSVVAAVAEVWREHGALSYQEFVGDEVSGAGTGSFVSALRARPEEAIIFGWVVFPSKAVRDAAGARVAADPRMEELLAPLTAGGRDIFDATRMAYGGFTPLVVSS